MTLFEHYGGFTTVSRLVMSFYDRILDDDDVASYFDDVDMRNLIDHQTKFMATLMGGPASYTDDALRHLHAHLKVDAQSFDRVAGHLRDTLTDGGMAPEHVDILVGEFNARKPLIVAS